MNSRSKHKNRYRLSTLLKKPLILLDAQSADNLQAIRELVDLIKKEYSLQDGLELFKRIVEREQLGSTIVTQNVAIPHCRTDSVKELSLAMAISRQGINFNGGLINKVKVIFLVVAPPEALSSYLKILAHIARLVREDFFVGMLTKAQTKDECLKIIRDYEEWVDFYPWGNKRRFGYV